MEDRTTRDIEREHLRLKLFMKRCPTEIAKHYFKEKELLHKAINLNLNNRYDKRNSKIYWRICRSDLLRACKIDSDIAGVTIQNACTEDSTIEKLNHKEKVNKSACNSDLLRKKRQSNKPRVSLPNIKEPIKVVNPYVISYKLLVEKE